MDSLKPFYKDEVRLMIMGYCFFLYVLFLKLCVVSHSFGKVAENWNLVVSIQSRSIANYVTSRHIIWLGLEDYLSFSIYNYVYALLLGNNYRTEVSNDNVSDEFS